MTSLCRFGLILLTLATFAACKKDAKTKTDDGAETASADAGADASNEPTIVYAEGPKPTDDTVIVSTPDASVTWADYQHAVRVGRLFAPSTEDGLTEELSPNTLATPHLQSMMGRSLLSRKLVVAEIGKRGITITDDEIRASLDDNPRLNKWSQLWDEPGKMAAELDKIGITVEDFRRLGFEQVAQNKLSDALAAEISEEDAWQAYQYERNTVQILGVSALNVPTSDELDTFTEQEGPAILEYFNKNKERYTYPARGEAVLLVPPSLDVEKKTLDDAAAALAAPNARPAEVAETYGLAVKEGQRFTNAEDSAIFGAELAKTGVTWKSARGSYVWKKVASIPPTTRELSFGLKREIAATLIRESRVAAEAKEKLVEAEKILREADLKFGEVTRESAAPTVEKLQALGVEAKLTPQFPQAQNGFVPGFGIHEKVAAAAFNATKEKPFPPEPMLSRERAFTFRLVDRNRPSKAAFEKEKEEYLKEFRERSTNGIVDRFIQEQFAKDAPEFNLTPIHVVYGQLQKPRN